MRGPQHVQLTDLIGQVVWSLYVVYTQELRLHPSPSLPLPLVRTLFAALSHRPRRPLLSLLHSFGSGAPAGLIRAYICSLPSAPSRSTSFQRIPCTKISPVKALGLPGAA